MSGSFGGVIDGLSYAISSVSEGLSSMPIKAQPLPSMKRFVCL